MRTWSVAAMLAALAVGGCGSGSRTTGDPIPVVPLPLQAASPLPLQAASPRQDAEDRDRRLRRLSRQATAERPALQSLPWLERHLAVDLAGATTDGRIELLVRSDLDPPAARRAYRRFLRRLRDDGRAYAATFRPAE